MTAPAETSPIPPSGTRSGAVSSQTAPLSALELLAQARQYVPSLTQLAGQIDVHLGLAGVEVARPDTDLVWERLPSGEFAWLRADRPADGVVVVPLP